MKICILSMQKVNNMGSLLQAYGLKQILNELGNEVEFIDIKKIDTDYNLLGNFVQDYSKEIEKTGFVGRISKIDKYLINRIVHRVLEKNQTKLFDVFRIEELHTNQESAKYDVCVIGSDEVFNCLNAGYWGFTTQLFGNVSQAEKVITYAASCGATKYEDLPETIVYKIKKTFEKVSAFSVRDKNTKEFVSKMSNKCVKENFDPVLIYNYAGEMKKEILRKLPEKYCIVYSYRNRIHTKDEIKAIKDFCKKYKLTPISVGAPQFWIKNFFVCSPFQCLEIFERASYVITDTFHGTIFAAKYTKKFAVLIRNSNKNKLEDLLGKLEIEEHLMTHMNEVEEKYLINNDIAKINQIIYKERNNTINYFKGNI